MNYFTVVGYNWVGSLISATGLAAERLTTVTVQYNTVEWFVSCTKK